jgi:hypothetical protein
VTDIRPHSQPRHLTAEIARRAAIEAKLHQHA